ncbi:MAG: HAD family hydrolase [Spirochaetota bacterium]
MLERDYAPVWPLPEQTSFITGTSIEIVRKPGFPLRPQHALFDFDGTLSLVREGWNQVMEPMFVHALLPFARPTETEESIVALVKNFVTGLTGKQTIYQAMRLADEIRERGGKPRKPEEYKAEYHERLMDRISHRREGLSRGTIAREECLVPGSIEILELLRERGVAIYIASGTDEPYVIEEAALLGLDSYAPGRIYGAQADHASFSKEMVIRRILQENRVDGTLLLAFGDGYVEIADCKAAGGTAIAVASDEETRSGKPDAWKRERLIGAGADLVIPDYANARALVDYLWTGKEPLPVPSAQPSYKPSSKPLANPSGRNPQT